MVEDFIARKHNRSDRPIDYLHPDLRQVLTPTYGVILYQEQVMQIAQILAGYTLGGADLLRRAMGKKKAEEMAKQRSVFTDGAVARNVSRARAEHIFDLMEKFAGYGFNKSHSAAYAMLAYQTAYLKAHYPAAFMAAVLSADMDRTDKVVTLIDDCALVGLKVLPPDVNASAHAFAVADATTIRYGLGAIKGVGRTAVDALVEEREAHGAYASLEDLCHRVELARVNRRVLEALIRSGSCDSLGSNRAALMERLSVAMQAGEQTARTVEAGQDDFFGLPQTAARGVSRAAATEPVWSEAQRLAGERETLGLYLTGHPIGRYERDLAQLVGVRIRDLAGEARPTGGEGERWSEARKVSAAGLILEIRRRGPRVSFVLDDRSGRIEVTLSEETHHRFRDLVVKDALVLVEGSLRFDEFSDAWRMQARTLQSLAAVRERQARRLLIDWPQECEHGELLSALGELLSQSLGGECTVVVRYTGTDAQGTLTLGDEWKVHATAKLIEQLERRFGVVRVAYGVASGASSAVSA
jgi:DNA polymerase-3 subunit alpha